MNSNRVVTPRQKICHALEKLVTERGFQWADHFEKDLPRKWKIFGDLALIQQDSCFVNAEWSRIGLSDVWPVVASSLNVNRVATYRAVKSDDFRSPDVAVVWPQSNGSQSCWVCKRENGIDYWFDATRSMFSVGNFSEKARLADMLQNQPVSDEPEVAVDLFAGIGYFSLSLLVKCSKQRLRRLYCCEWNPVAVEALRRNLTANKVDDTDRCVILEGDCRQVAPVQCCQRVYLGLIPSSGSGWKAACRALSPQTGGVLYVHTVVNLKTSSDEQEARRCSTAISDIFKQIDANRHWKVSCSFISHVKLYGPMLRHVVVDLQCLPDSS